MIGRAMQSSDSSRIKEAGSSTTSSSFFRLVMIVLGGVVFAFLIDIADFAFMLSTFLSVSGIFRGTAAAIAEDPFWGRDLNRWDEAVVLIFLGVIVYWAAP